MEATINIKENIMAEFIIEGNDTHDYMSVAITGANTVGQNFRSGYDPHQPGPSITAG